MKKPIIHVYTIFYNEEIILPYLLRHYDFAEKIVCFDNQSTDRSPDIVDSHPQTERIVFDTDGQLFDSIHVRLKGEYRKSRGIADWVICVDADEFIYHPDLINLLIEYRKQGITYPKIDGFEMVADDLPTTKGQIYEEIKNGFPNEGYGKRVVFDPMLEIKFDAGCHRAIVEGNKVESEKPEIKLLHYRFLGKKFFVQRSIERKARVSEENKKAGWGTHYLNPEGYFSNLFDEVRAVSKPVVTESPVRKF